MPQAVPPDRAVGARGCINGGTKNGLAGTVVPRRTDQGTARALAIHRALKMHISCHAANLAHSPQLWQEVSLMGSRHGNTILPCLDTGNFRWEAAKIVGFTYRQPPGSLLSRHLPRGPSHMESPRRPGLLGAGFRRWAVANDVLLAAKISPGFGKVSRVYSVVIHDSVPRRILGAIRKTLR